ncbi:MAG: hypothetical protein LLF94_05690 [Chlamydiales bacterium]|nr:hypothetical protein [Chlamydiales bacterium]
MADPYDQEVFKNFLKATHSKNLKFNLEDQCRAIESEFTQLNSAVAKFVSTLLLQPFIAIFGVWIKQHGYMYPGMLDAVKTLLEHDLIMIHDETGDVWTVEKANAFDHYKILNAIRCKSAWTIKRKEELVRIYIAFMYWLHEETRGYVRRYEDPVWRRSQKRALAFGRYIDFLSALPNPKSQLVANLLYFGSDLTLDQVLKLELSNVDFTSHTIAWESTKENATPTSYPEHVFHDIKALIGDKKKGLLFREQNIIGSATIFRHFNDAAEQVGLGSSFGPKKLVMDTQS